MSDQRLKIPRASDRHVAEVFQALASKWGVSPVNVSALGFGRISSVTLQAEPVGDWKALLDHDSQLIESIGLQICGLNVTYFRGGNYQPDHKSAVFDEIVFSPNNNQQGSNADKFDLVAFLNKEFCSFDPTRLPGAVPTDAQSQLLAIHQSTLERLEKLNEDLVRQSMDFRQKLEDQYDTKAEANEQEHKLKLDELGADFKARMADVDARDRSLQEKLATIDDRNNTHVRREIRDKMLDDVKQRISKFGVSESTEKKRRPVLYGIVGLITAFALLLLWTGLEISAMDRQWPGISGTIHNIVNGVPEGSDVAVDRTNLYLLWIRFTLFSLGLVGTLLYYIKWQNNWAEQHSSSEFQLQQFYVDVNRANWVIESCLEWRKDTDSPIPRELLASITNGLFVNNQAEPERVIHPADELASALMGSASKLKLKVGDSELDFDKPNKITNKALAVKN